MPYFYLQVKDNVFRYFFFGNAYNTGCNQRTLRIVSYDIATRKRNVFGVAISAEVIISTMIPKDVIHYLRHLSAAARTIRGTAPSLTLHSPDRRPQYGPHSLSEAFVTCFRCSCFSSINSRINYEYCQAEVC